ncbi:MAG: hypothetical protein RJA70_996, partial [Pseudomonadota bacterium]
MKLYKRLFIDGEWAEASGSGRFDVIHSVTEEVMGRVPEGTSHDAARAVEAARAAFDSWAATPRDVRAMYLTRIHEGVVARTEELAATVTGEVGVPLQTSVVVQVGHPANTAKAYAELLDEYSFEQRIGHSLVVREPVGVVACITPWNFPLHQAMAKVAPALAAGCTVVLKPSEVAPLTAFALAEIIDAAGLPRGVFNLVSGTGATVGEALAGHDQVDMVSFTGSTRAGRRVSEVAARTIKRVAVELGGKSACIILDDAPLEQAVTAGLANCFRNCGQTCSAWSRMLVPRAKYAAAVEIAKRAAEALDVGDPRVDGTDLGPLASALQRDRVRSYISTGIEEGATLVTGGPKPPPGLIKGYYVSPTVFANVHNTMTIAREEVFGPVLCLIAHDSDDDAVRLANDSIYGLSAGVWSADSKRADAVARRLRTGQVDING